MLRWLAIICCGFIFLVLFYVGVFIYYRIKAARIPPEQLLLEGMDKEQRTRGLPEPSGPTQRQ